MLPYIGGKNRQAKWISSFLPNKIKKYVEPFGGAFWVYLKSDISAEEVIYNDINPFMANIFTCCKQYDHFLEYIESVDPQNEELFNSFRDEVVEKFKTRDFEMPDFDLAWKYVYIATQAFSGIINEKVKMVDMNGKYRSKYLSFQNKLKDPKFREKLDKITVKNQSYSEILKNEDSEDTFFYVDPPYYGTEDLYGFHPFTKEDHHNLIELLKNTKSKWMLSYYEFPQLLEWFPEDQWRWERKDYKKASMASKGKGQTVGTEVLVLNYDSLIHTLFF